MLIKFFLKYGWIIILPYYFTSLLGGESPSVNLFVFTLISMFCCVGSGIWKVLFEGKMKNSRQLVKTSKENQKAFARQAKADRKKEKKENRQKEATKFFLVAIVITPIVLILLSRCES